MKRNIVIIAAAVLLIAIAIVSNAAKDSRPTEAVAKEGYLAPNFTLETMDGGTYTFDHDAVDKPVLINFWASWCQPCKDEAPALAALHEKYREQIDFLGVNVTIWEFFGTEKADEFVQKYDWKMPILLDNDGDVIKLYRVIAVPVTVLIDQNGVIKHIINGEFNPEELDRWLAKL